MSNINVEGYEVWNVYYDLQDAWKEASKLNYEGIKTIIDENSKGDFVLYAEESLKLTINL